MFKELVLTLVAAAVGVGIAILVVGSRDGSDWLFAAIIVAAVVVGSVLRIVFLDRDARGS